MSEQSASSEPITFDDISTPEPIVKSPGEFTMESESEQLAESLTSSKEKKEIAKLEKQLTKGDDNGKEKESEKSEEKKLLSKKADEKADSDEPKEPLGTSDKPVRAPKVLKLNVGGKDIEVTDTELMVPTRVSNKNVKVPLSELQDNYAGKVDYEKKYRDFYEERKTYSTEKEGFESEKTQTIQTINKFWKMVTEENDPLNAAVYMAEILGNDPEAVRSQYIEARTKLRQQLREMSDEQLAELDRLDELGYYKKKEEYRKQDEQRSREHADIAKRVDAIREQQNITPEAFRQCYEDLKAEAERTNIDVASITPEMVAQYHAITDRRAKVNDFVQTSFSEDRQPAIAKQLKEVWDKNPDLSLEDIKDIGQQAFGKGRSSLAKKVMDQKQTIKHPQHEAMSWDQI
jgi:hypothetical protein